MRRRTFLGGLAALATTPLLARIALAQSDPVARISAFVELVREYWRIPGVAVAVIHEGKPLMAAGFGVKNIKSRAKVDEHTAFNIGSCSKAFTSCAAAIAIEDRRAEWDDLARKFLPDLTLYDPGITAAVTLRDLLSHRVGLSRAYVGEFGSDLTRAQVIARAAQAGKLANFRERMCYSNLGFVIAAEAVGRAAGMSFERFVEARILQPLGMKDSTVEGRGWRGHRNVADPHSSGTDYPQVPIPHTNHDSGVGAGSIFVSAHDAVAWLEAQLGLRKLVSTENLREMHTPQIKVPEVHGLGWSISAFRGQPFVWHDGSTPGFTARVRVEPGTGYAVLVAVNEGSVAAAAIVGFIGMVLGRSPERNWIDFYEVSKARSLVRAADQMARDQKAEPMTGDSVLPLSAFVGTYHHSGFGTLTLREQDGALRIAIKDLSSANGWLVRYSSMHFKHQQDFNRPSPAPRPLVPYQSRVGFEAGEGKVIAAEWKDTWFGSARFERVS